MIPPTYAAPPPAIVDSQWRLSSPRVDKRHCMSSVRVFSCDQVECVLNAGRLDTTRIIENTVLDCHQRQRLVGLRHCTPSLFLADPPDSAAAYATQSW